MYEIGMFLEMHFKRRFKPYVLGKHPNCFLLLKRFICHLIELDEKKFLAKKLGAGGAPIKSYSHLKLASPHKVYIAMEFTLS